MTENTYTYLANDKNTALRLLDLREELTYAEADAWLATCSREELIEGPCLAVLITTVRSEKLVFFVQCETDMESSYNILDSEKKLLCLSDNFLHAIQGFCLTHEILIIDVKFKKLTPLMTETMTDALLDNLLYPNVIPIVRDFHIEHLQLIREILLHRASYFVSSEYYQFLKGILEEPFYFNYIFEKKKEQNEAI
jgi:hypothetical protein